MWNYSEARLRNVFIALMALAILGELALLGLIFDGVDWDSGGSNVLAIICLAIIALTSIEAWNVGSRIHRRAFVDWPQQNPETLARQEAEARGGGSVPPVPPATPL